MRTKWIYAGIAGVCAVVICVLGIDNNRLKYVNAVVEEYNGELIATARTHKFKSVEIGSIGSLIPDSMTLIDESDNIVPVTKIFGEQKVLVFRYSSLQCKSCVDSQLEIMNHVLDGEKHRIIFIACYNNARDMVVFKKAHSIDYPIYRLSSCHLPLPADSINEPYFFVMDNKMTPEYIFIPQKDYPQFSIDYIKNVLTYLEL